MFTGKCTKTLLKIIYKQGRQKKLCFYTVFADFIKLLEFAIKAIDVDEATKLKVRDKM